MAATYYLENVGGQFGFFFQFNSTPICYLIVSLQNGMREISFQGTSYFLPRWVASLFLGPKDSIKCHFLWDSIKSQRRYKVGETFSCYYFYNFFYLSFLFFTFGEALIFGDSSLQCYWYNMGKAYCPLKYSLGFWISGATYPQHNSLF